MIRPRVPLVVVCGLRRSGSTWLHNAARLILESNGPVWSGFEDQYFFGSAPLNATAHVVKTHRFSDHLAAASSCILGSVRDLRDVAASAVRRRLTPPGNAVKWLLKVWTEEYARWRPILDHETRYTDIMYDPVRAVTKLAQLLGVPISDDDAAEIATRLTAGDGFVPHKPSDHVTDGRVGSWDETLDGPMIEGIERSLSPYAPDLLPKDVKKMRGTPELGVTVGIVVKNATNSAEACVRSAGDVPVVVLNNGCFPDHNTELGKALADLPKVRIIETASKSLASAWNQLIREAKTPWVVLANDDVRFRPGWLRAFQNAARDPNVLQVHFPAQSTYSAFAIHKRLVAKIGWFDEGFRGIYYEDEDWYCRLQEEYGETSLKSHIRWLDVAVNSREFLRKDIEKWGSLARDLKKDVNEKHFWQVWRKDPNGVQPKDPNLPRIWRIAPVADPYPELSRSYAAL